MRGREARKVAALFAVPHLLRKLSLWASTCGWLCMPQAGCVFIEPPRAQVFLLDSTTQSPCPWNMKSLYTKAAKVCGCVGRATLGCSCRSSLWLQKYKSLPATTDANTPELEMTLSYAFSESQQSGKKRLASLSQARCTNPCLSTQHFGNSSRQVSVSLRPGCSTEQVIGDQGSIMRNHLKKGKKSWRFTCRSGAQPRLWVGKYWHSLLPHLCAAGFAYTQGGRGMSLFLLLHLV